MVNSFRDLMVWQRSVEMTVVLNRLTWSFPQEERLGLASHLRQASVFVTGNIAAGWRHQSDGASKDFLRRASGSILEVQNQLKLATELGLGDNAIRHHAEDLSREVGNMLVSLMN
jgi:four helix bundle protein